MRMVAGQSQPIEESNYDVIVRVHRANFGAYGARKVWRALRRLGMDAGRDQVARLMKAVGLQGVTRERSVRTTKPADQSARPADLVARTFAAGAPNRLWVSDLTYVWTIAGFCYTAFIVETQRSSESDRWTSFATRSTCACCWR